MTLALKPGNQMKLTRLAGVAAAVAGALLFGLTDPFASSGPATIAPATVHVDWVLLAGLVCIIGGGLLVQVTCEERHG